jgi:hypothetical protein
MRNLLLCLTLILILPAARAAAAEHPRPQPHAASEPVRTSVFVGHTGSDAAGRAFVAGLRDAIRLSSQFTLAGVEDEAQLVLIAVSVSPASSERVASAVSLVYVANNEWRSLLGSAARFVGRDRAEAMGRAALKELTAVMAAYDPTVPR